jgi:hypothetical protein
MIHPSHSVRHYAGSYHNTYCNPKKTNLEFYWEDLKATLGVVPRVIHSMLDVELAVDMVQRATLSSYHQN